MCERARFRSVRQRSMIGQKLFLDSPGTDLAGGKNPRQWPKIDLPYCKYAGEVDRNLRGRATERQKISQETTADPPLGRSTFLYRHFSKMICSLFLSVISLSRHFSKKKSSCLQTTADAGLQRSTFLYRRHFSGEEMDISILILFQSWHVCSCFCSGENCGDENVSMCWIQIGGLLFELYCALN